MSEKVYYPTVEMAEAEAKMTEPRYWFCVIGPTDNVNLPQGSDLPMREAVRDAFEKTAWHPDPVCMSGWGITREQRDRIMDAIRQEGE